MYIASQMLSEKVNADELGYTSEVSVVKAVDEDMKKRKKVRWNCFSILCFNLKFRMPTYYIKKCCRCLEMRRKDRMIAQRYAQLERELHVVYIVKTLRVIKKLVQGNLTKDQWIKAFKAHSKLDRASSSVKSSSSSSHSSDEKEN